MNLSDFAKRELYGRLNQRTVVTVEHVPSSSRKRF